MEAPKGYDHVYSDKVNIRVPVPEGGEIRALLHAAADSIADGFKMEGERDNWMIVAEIQAGRFKLEVSAKLTVSEPKPAGIG